MAGKPCVFTPRPLASALDRASKNALIDLLTDIATASVGDGADEQDLIAWIQPRLDIVLQHRHDAAIRLEHHASAYAEWEEREIMRRAERDEYRITAARNRQEAERESQ